MTFITPAAKPLSRPLTQWWRLPIWHPILTTLKWIFWFMARRGISFYTILTTSFAKQPSCRNVCLILLWPANFAEVYVKNVFFLKKKKNLICCFYSESQGIIRQHTFCFVWETAEPLSTTLNQSEPLWTNLNQSEPVPFTISQLTRSSESLTNIPRHADLPCCTVLSEPKCNRAISPKKR